MTVKNIGEEGAAETYDFKNWIVYKSISFSPKMYKDMKGDVYIPEVKENQPGDKLDFITTNMDNVNIKYVPSKSKLISEINITPDSYNQLLKGGANLSNNQFNVFETKLIP